MAFEDALKVDIPHWMGERLNTVCETVDHLMTLSWRHRLNGVPSIPKKPLSGDTNVAVNQNSWRISMENTGVAESDATINVGELEKMDQSVAAERHIPVTLSRLKWYQTTARYVLGAIFLFGAVDGALYLLGGIYLHGKPREPFLIALEQARYFWAFLKSIQLVGAVSLLANYKPALGVALLIPISSVMFLFYLFELPGFIPFGCIMATAMIVLCRAYAKSYVHIFDNY